MKLSDIKLEMQVKHISDVGCPPQKLIVIKINESAVEDGYMDSICCEWITRHGTFQTEWLNPIRLEKW